ncbi:MAG: glutamate 5-kinase [Nannocystis sp.]|uniref:glutamate 5-kinase n=1 Tax=Nannocystis sp. TaxID=1962667 RepID=UPI0024243AE2|nr:glutamate 5-kinase [Nannocystis sp.]MBK9757608.1 glutamate 5-kinase [Nannocystis sp.]
MSHRQDIAAARRIVIKLGTHVITHPESGLALGRLCSIVEAVAALHRQGREIVLVSSGAVGMGQRALGLARRPDSLGLRQACAAVGQGQLMALYSQNFGQLGVKVAQVLLTQEDLGDRDRALCVRTTLTRLLELGVVPILNENDSVSVRELIEYRRNQGQEPEAGALEFGDNDGLSARVAVALDADLLVLLTDVDGLFTANPRNDPSAARIPELADIDDATLARANGSNTGGTGGMTSKLEAARLASRAGLSVLITSGHQPGALELALTGADIGTLIVPHARRSQHRRQIASGAPTRGALVVNDGAIAAMVERKASLLPVGLVHVDGEFSRGDIVEIRDPSGRVHGRGLVNYDAKDCRLLIGRHSADISLALGWRGYDTIVTRDNLVLSEL